MTLARSLLSRLPPFVLTIAALVVTGPLYGAEIIIISLDGEDSGLNDPSPVDPVPGNPGTTLGEQRLNAVQAAANWWGARIASNVTIEIQVQFGSLVCDQTNALLGVGGPLGGAFTDQEGIAPDTYTWYPLALANSFAGADLNVGLPDIRLLLNEELDNSKDCLLGVGWSYAIGAYPEDEGVSLYDTARHELAHGLGFLTVVDLVTGEEFQGLTDHFARWLQDGDTGMLWSDPAMSNAQRAASATSGNLGWAGDCVVTGCTQFDGRPTGNGGTASSHLMMFAPETVVPGASVNHFDQSAPDELMQPASPNGASTAATLALMDDIGWGPIVIDSIATGDIDGDMIEDYAVLLANFRSGGNAVHVRSGADGSNIRKLNFSAALAALEMRRVPDFAGTLSDEIAVLLIDRITNGVRVLTRDLGDGSTLSTLNFSATFKPLEIRVVPDFAGGDASEIALLTRERYGTNGRVRVTIKDLEGIGGTLANVNFSNAFTPVGMVIIDSYAETPAPELAVLGRDCSDQRVGVFVKDAQNGKLIVKLLTSAAVTPLGAVRLADTGLAGGTEADEVGIVGRRASDGKIFVRFLDAQNGVKLKELTFGNTLEPIDWGVVPNYTGGELDEFALLVRSIPDGSVRVKIKDIGDGATLANLTYSSAREPRALGVFPDMTLNGAPEMGVTGIELLGSDRIVVVKDAATNTRTNSANIP